MCDSVFIHLLSSKADIGIGYSPETNPDEATCTPGGTAPTHFQTTMGHSSLIKVLSVEAQMAYKTSPMLP